MNEHRIGPKSGFHFSVRCSGAEGASVALSCAEPSGGSLVVFKSAHRVTSEEIKMKSMTVAVWASALLAGALTLSAAQAQQGSNAATTQGSGAVGTMGTGENPNTSG